METRCITAITLLIYRNFFPVILFVSIVLGSCKDDSVAPITVTLPQKPIIKGVDVSFLPDILAEGYSYKNDKGIAEHPLLTLKNNGINTIRLRLWHDADSTSSSLIAVKNLVNVARSYGLQVCISVHYSNTWADPGHQTTPKPWQQLPIKILVDSVVNYTKLVVQTLQPDYIQIGNEINNGILWPTGSSSALSNFRLLLGDAIYAVRQTSKSTKIMLHYAGLDGAQYFFNNTVSNLDYDMVALSYYPIWHGKSLEAIQVVSQQLKASTGKPVCITETSYPFTLGWNDYTNNVVGDSNQLIKAFAPTTEGQAKYMQELIKMVKDESSLVGCIYWGAEWVSYRGNTATNGSTWENQALWDFNGVALPAMKAFK